MTPNCATRHDRRIAAAVAPRAAPARRNACGGAPMLQPADSLPRRTHSLFGQKNSLFPEEQGIGRKLLNPLRDQFPKPPHEAGSGRNF